MQTVRPQVQQNIVADQQRRQLFLRYVNRGWLVIGLVALIAWPFFSAQRGEFTVVAVITLPSYLLIRYLNLSGRTRLAGIVLVSAINFGFYGLFLYLAREMGAVLAFATQATVWQLMGLAVLLAGSLVDKWAAPGLALLDTLLFIVTRLTLAPGSDPRPSIIVFWWMVAVITWLYESTGQQAEAQREAALAELHDNRRFLADLIEYSGALIFVKDRAGRYELINRKWEEVTGLDRARVIGRTDEELFPGPIGQQFRANDLEVIQTGEVLEREEILEDERIKRYFISIKFPVRDETGSVRGTCGMTTEITERKRAEQALAESEAIFQLFMEHSPMYVFFKDEQLRSVRLSKNYETMLGKPLSELLGKTMDELFPSELAKSMIVDDRRILDVGRQIEAVEELNGRVYRTIKFPIAQQDRPRWLAGYTIDITEQKRAEEALRQSEDKFSTAFHTSPDSININRLSDGLYLEINEGFTSMTGYTAEDVAGRTSLDINIWADPADRARLVQALREHGQVMNLEASFRMKDGRIMTGLMSARLIEIDGEKCILSITRDITDRKRAEDEIKSLSRFPNENPNPVLRVNQGGDILYANDASQQLLQAWARTTGDEALTYWRRLAADALAGGANRTVDIECDRQIYSFVVVPILEGGYVNLYGRDITERKRAEEALRETSRTLQAIIQASPVAIIAFDAEGHVTAWHPVAEQIFGWSEAEVMGRLAPHIPQDMLGDFHTLRQRVVRGEVLTNLELRRARKNGTPIDILVNTAPLYDPLGNLDGYMAVIADITERKQAEAALRESEEKFRAMIEQASDGFTLIDEQGIILEWNRAQEHIWGLKREEVLGQPFYDVQFQVVVSERRTPERYAALKAMTLEALRTGQSPLFSQTIEGELQRPDGQRVTIQQSIFLINSRSGYRIGAMSLDITERKHADAALKESEQKMRAIVDAAPFGAHLYELESDGRLVFMGANHSADQILHLDHRAFVGKTIEEAFPPLIETDIPAAYRHVAETGERYQLDQIAYNDAGISGAFELHAFQTGPNQMAVFFRDVTERKQMEDALRRLNEDLEARVAERTRELAEANARLTELDQLKSKFVSDVSHELRTPIANLKLYIDLLKRGKPDKHSQYIQVLQQQVRRVAALVDDILDLSRLERRKEQGMIYRAVAVNDVVAQVVVAHQPRAEADGLLLTFEPAPRLPVVRADANQLAQVVTNLIANALSYTTAGYVQISTFAQDAEVCLCVADSGSGIAPDDLPHVFERFYRGKHVLKNDVPGTGLGLAIVKEIVDLHEGRIEVDSRPEEGTTFRVWLPVA